MFFIVRMESFFCQLWPVFKKCTKATLEIHPMYQLFCFVLCEAYIEEVTCEHHADDT